MAKESFFQKAKADGQVFFKTVNLVTQISKLKMALNKKKQEREKIMRAIGVAIFDIYHETRQLDSTAITNAAVENLHLITDLDVTMKELTDEMERIKGDFRATQAKSPPSDQGPAQ